MFSRVFLFLSKSQSASLLHNYLVKGCALIMSKKLTVRGHYTQTYAEVFQTFISAKTAQGGADITIRNYHNNLHVISKYLKLNVYIYICTRKVDGNKRKAVRSK